MALSRKHYVKTAAILADNYVAAWNYSPTAASIVHELTLDLADMFQEDNPNFDKVRFLNAANPNMPYS